MVLIDDGSALNVCPLKTTSCLGLSIEDFVSSGQHVRAYDNNRREVLGIVTLELTIGPMIQKKMMQKLQVETIKNTLMGDLWVGVVLQMLVQNWGPDMDFEDEDERMEGSKSEYFRQNVRPSNKERQNLFGEWMDSIKCLDGYAFDKPIDMEAWEGAAHPMEDPLEETKITKPFTYAKNIFSIPIESISASIAIPVKSIYDHVSIPIDKETFNNGELKQGHVEPIKEETQSVNLGTDDEPKMVQIGNTLTSSENDALVTLLKEFKEVFAWSYEDMPRLNFLTTNNATEYEACIMGLQAALSLGVEELEVYDDSSLKLASKFGKIRYQYVPRMQNQIPNALATMASMMDGPKEDQAQPIVVEQKEEPAYCLSIKGDEEINGEGEWYSNILQYLKEGTYPKFANKNGQLTIQRLSTNYIICGERLYRRSYDGIHLLYMTAKEA
uniref:RNase H type-1 domain-containing protein n=1 Tax=Quercus lobata TaxID=97700 RepID=A0A7N2N325_QUELO